VFEDEENAKLADEDEAAAARRKRRQQNKEEKERVQLPSVQQMTSHNINAANQQMKSQLDMKVQSFRMFKAVQKRMKDTMSYNEAYDSMDTNNYGYLTLRDFQINLSKHFNLSLKAKEVRSLFQEIDGDGNGIIKFQELEEFYNRDYNQKV
jgi:hypothetical protein